MLVRPSTEIPSTQQSYWLRPSRRLITVGEGLRASEGVHKACQLHQHCQLMVTCLGALRARCWGQKRMVCCWHWACSVVRCPAECLQQQTPLDPLLQPATRVTPVEAASARVSDWACDVLSQAGKQVAAQAGLARQGLHCEWGDRQQRGDGRSGRSLLRMASQQDALQPHCRQATLRCGGPHRSGSTWTG